MDEKHLQAIEKVTLVLAAVVVGAALVALPARVALGVSLGAGLMALNAFALRRLGARAFRTFKRPGAAILLFNGKMAAVVAIVYLVLRYAHVDPVAFVIGISIFPVAILIVGVRHVMSPPAEKSDG